MNTPVTGGSIGGRTYSTGSKSRRLTFGDVNRQIENVTQSVFEPQLEDLGLTEDSIQKQSLPELEATLAKCDEAIKEPDSFGKLRLTVNSSGIVTVADTDANPEVVVEQNILPLLLERKNEVIGRIKVLRPEQQLSKFRNDVEHEIEDPATRREVLEILDRRLEKEQIDQENLDREQRRDTARAEVLERERRFRIEALERETRLQIEVRERNWAIFRSILGRESVASLVGALLLIALAVALIVGMFNHTAAPEIITSSFLLILGYFFGQTAAREKTNKSSHDRDE